MHAHTAARLAGVLGVAMLGYAPAVRAAPVTLTYDGVPKGPDFRTAPYVEHGITTTVVQGHYELYANSTGADGNQAFNLDEENPASTAANPQPPIPAKVAVTVNGGYAFDVLSLDVVNPADTVGEYTITALGGTGGSIPVPTVAGRINFTQYAPAFQGVSAVVITQHVADAVHPHAFTFDEVTVNTVPEPSAIASLFAAGVAMTALGRRRIR